MPYDPNDPASGYTSMQAQAGIVPPFAAPQPQVVFPGQISAMMAQGGPGGAMMGLGAGAQQIQTMAGASPMLQGPTGLMMPMGAGAAFNPYGAPSARPMGAGGPSIFSGLPPQPPPVYAGYQGQTSPFLPPPPAAFQNPYTAGVYQREAGLDRGFAMSSSAMGLGARLGGDALGAMVGGRMGGAWGAVAGFVGAEALGVGRASQNLFMNQAMAPAINMRGYASGIESMSRGFMNSGPFMNEAGGGFSYGAATQSARMLEDMSLSRGFRAETHNRFNTGDVMKITQLSGQNDLLQGVGSPGQMRDRVRDVAKSLSAFMELAHEPDVQRAISTMGSLRASGLNLSETMQAVSHGRAFARMAGTSFQDMMGVGGALGSQTLQSMGLSQGLGVQTGMMNYGLARAAQNAGSLGPGMMNLMGGAQGYANMNNMFAGSFLQSPMVAPGMMSASGGLDANAVRAMMSGRMDMFGMTGRGAGALQGMTGRMGIEGLGMAIGMQPMLQDQLGRMMQSQGPFAQRLAEDQQVMGLSRQMGMRGAAGYMTAAQAMGMDRTQALARATEMGDGRYYDRMRSQIQVRAREGSSEEIRALEASRPGMVDDLASQFGSAYAVRGGIDSLHEGVRNITEAFAGGGGAGGWRPQSSEDRRRVRQSILSGDADRFARGAGSRPGGGLLGAMGDWQDVSRANGGVGVVGALSGALSALGGSGDTRRAWVNELETSRRYASNLAPISAADQSAAMRSMSSEFQHSAAAQSAYATNVANLYAQPQGAFGGALGMGINAVTRGLGMRLTGNMIDIGNIAGGADPTSAQHRAAYVSAMQGAGQSAAQAGADFDRNPSGAIRSVNAGARFDAGAAGRRRMAEDASRLTPGGGIIDSEAMSRRNYSDLFGSGVGGNEHSRRAIAQVQRDVGEGFGSTPAKRAASQRLMAAAALLSVATNDPTRRAAAVRQRAQLEAEAARAGLSPEEIQRALGHATDVADAQHYDTNSNLRTAVGSTELGQISMRTMGMAAQGDASEYGARLTAASVSNLSQGRGALADVLRGVVDSEGHLNNDRLSSNLSGASGGQLEEIARRYPQLRSLIRRYVGASPREQPAILNQIKARLAGMGGGEERISAQDAYRDQGAVGHIGHALSEGDYAGAAQETARLGVGILSGGLLGGSGEERYVRRHTTRAGTNAADAAQQQLAAVDGAEGAAQGAGIGGAADQLVQASADIRQAAADLRGAVSGHGINNLIDSNNNP